MEQKCKEQDPTHEEQATSQSTTASSQLPVKASDEFKLTG
jgi:hypothetical protein